jgi:hypothetical protein
MTPSRSLAHISSKSSSPLRATDSASETIGDPFETTRWLPRVFPQRVLVRRYRPPQRPVIATLAQHLECIAEVVLRRRPGERRALPDPIF